MRKNNPKLDKSNENMKTGFNYLSRIGAGVLLTVIGAMPVEAEPVIKTQTEVEIKSIYDRFYTAPKALRDFDSVSTRVRVSETLNPFDCVSLGATVAARQTSDPFYTNEEYSSGKPKFSLDRLWARYVKEGLEVRLGKIEDPFKTNPVSFDKDLNPEGVAASFTSTSLDCLDTLEVRGARYRDIDNNPSAGLSKAEIFGTKKIGSFFVGGGASYTDIDDINGPLRTNSKGAEYRFGEALGKIAWNTGNKIVNRLIVFGNCVRNFAMRIENESRLGGCRADLFNDKAYVDGAFFEKDKDPFPATISHDNIPPTNADGWKVGAGLKLNLPGGAKLGIDGNYYNPELRNGQEIQHWDVSATINIKF